MLSPSRTRYWGFLINNLNKDDLALIRGANIEEKDYYKYADDVISGRRVAGKWVKLACQRFMKDLENPAYIFDMKKFDFVESIFHSVKHFKGRSYGKRFDLSPWEAFIVANLYCFLVKKEEEYTDPETGEIKVKRKYVRRFRNAYISLSRKSGKLLSLDTPIPTPEGWSTMGDLKVGDYVFGADGKPVKVLFKSDVDYSPEAYRITFEDGTTVDACADHQWFIKKRDKKPPRVWTTKELFNSTYKRLRRDGKGWEYLCRVPMAQPVEYSAKNLSLDPYILGVWLGDGTLGKGQISTDERDLDMYDYLNEILGQPHMRKDKRGHGVCLDYHLPLKNKLEELGVLNNKHIPQVYLQGSVEQRMALLQGLMDTDGYCSKNAECEIQQKNVQLADGICELLSSLGIKYSRVEKIPTIDGVGKDKVQRIQFFTDKQRPCFRLKRKYDRLKDNLNDRMLWKSIINIEPTESVPMQCISVEENAFGEGLYLFGKTFTVTHNTALAAMLCLLDLFLEPSAESCLAANTRDQAAICYDLAKGFSRSLDSTGKHLKVLRKGIEFKDRQSQLKVLSGDVNTLDGLNPSTYVLDEFHAAQTTDMLEVLASGQGQREQPLGIIITTAGLNLDCPCKQYEDQCIEVLKGNLEEETNFIFICGVDEEDDPIRDESCWEKANPNLGITVDKDYLRARVNEAIVHPERETSILTKNFNKWVNSASVWISDSYVEPCFKVNGENYKFDWERFRGQPCWIGCDLSENCDLTALVFLFYSEEEQRFYACPFYFLPRSAISEASTQLKVYYELMEKNGYLIVTDTNDGLVTDYDYITRLILDYIERYDLMLQTIYTDKYNATAWVTSAVKDYNLPIDYFSQTVASFNGPTRQVEFLVKTGRLTMHANPLMLWNFRCVDLTQDRAGNVKPTKKSWKKQKIDGVICLIQAIAAFYNTYAGAPEIFSLTDGD